MRRRVFFVAAPAALASCALAQRPYAERRDWPLAIRRPVALPPASRGKTLLVRTIRAGPGLEARGLQSIETDGSIKTAYYEEWSVPPAQSVEDALRRWLADCGRFSAVLAQGSRVPADITLEGELSALWTDRRSQKAESAVAITAIETRGEPARIIIQREFRAQAPVAEPSTPATDVAAMREALAQSFGDIERSLS